MNTENTEHTEATEASESVRDVVPLAADAEVIAEEAEFDLRSQRYCRFCRSAVSRRACHDADGRLQVHGGVQLMDEARRLASAGEMGDFA